MLRIAYFLLMVLFSCNKGEVVSYSNYLNHNDTVKYVGKEECRMCHAEIYNSYIQTGMGKSFNFAVKEHSALFESDMSVVYDTSKNLYYKPYWQRDSLYILEYRLRENDTIHKFSRKVDYKIGSGHHTNSHLFDINGYIHQIPYTYYTQNQISDLPPGFENGNNSRFDREIGIECMSCHNAYPIHDIESLNKYTEIPLGIDCERCHGPGELHVKQKKSGIIIDTSKYIDYSIVNPADLPIDLQFDVCQRCHLQGTTVLAEGKSYLDFKPGMSLSDVMDIYIPKYTNNDEFIMASHVDRLKQSKCFTKGDITCISCHDPHESVTSIDLDYFDNKCMSCHDVCEDKKVSNCTSCHMPNSNSTDIMHVSITDHKISVPSDVQVSENKVFKGLVPINNSSADFLSRAKAYLKHFESFNSNSIFLDSAYYFLKLTKNGNYTAYLQYYYLSNQDNMLMSFVMNTSLDTIAYSNNELAMAFTRAGEVYSTNNMNNLARIYFDRAIELMPLVIDYKIKYATFLINNNELDLAISILNEALSMNPIIKELHLNLAYIDILQENYISAEKRLNYAILLDPDYLLAYENLLLIAQIQDNSSKSTFYLDKILEIAPDHKVKEILKKEI